MEKKLFQVIMVAGKKGSGKDTFAERLVSFHAFEQLSFAFFLKKLCITILREMDCNVDMSCFTDADKKEQIITDINGEQFEFERRSGNMFIRYFMTYRQFLQTVGTEMFRNTIHTKIWTMPVKRAIREIMNDYTLPINGVVISDFRYPNEYEEINNFCKRFGKLIELYTVGIIRPGTKDDSHSSENSLKNFEFDIVINNDGTLAEFYQKIDKIPTGAWKIDKLNHEIKVREQSSFLQKYSPESH